MTSAGANLPHSMAWSQHSLGLTKASDLYHPKDDMTLVDLDCLGMTLAVHFSQSMVSDLEMSLLSCNSDSYKRSLTLAENFGNPIDLVRDICDQCRV